MAIEKEEAFFIGAGCGILGFWVVARFMVPTIRAKIADGITTKIIEFENRNFGAVPVGRNDIYPQAVIFADEILRGLYLL